ncbi:MAG: radical SAM family heme chaperone HemW [Phycisphaerales bacterium]
MPQEPTPITVSGQRGVSGVETLVKSGVSGVGLAPMGVLRAGGGGGGGGGGDGEGLRVGSLYVHVPFCFHKCHYCDFYSFVDKADQQGAFVEALLVELRAWAWAVGAGTGGELEEHRSPADRTAVARPPVVGRGGLRTLFVGGGTPSLLRVELWREVLAELDALFDVRARSRGGELEFTVECNPETVTAELMGVLSDGGVNRVSIGAQSFNDAHLKTLERWHDPANVAKAVSLARAAGIRRRSIDLIFGVPGQTVEQWREDMARALQIADDPAGGEMGLEHLSCYNLTYEPNTAMTARLKRGEFVALPEESEIEMFRVTREVLRSRGFEAYEVSNFARGEAARCRHNLAYWRQEQWLAVGPSASSHVGGWRWKNTPNLGEWMRSVMSGSGGAGERAAAGVSAVIDLEPPDAKRGLRERIMLGLRLSEGISAEEMLGAARGLGLDAALRRAASRVIGKGLMTEEGGVWRLTDAGVLVGDSVAAEMMAAVR